MFTGHHKKCGALPTIKPYLLAIRFYGVRSLTRKINSNGAFPHFGFQSFHLNICYNHQDLQ